MRQWTYKLAKMDMRGALKSVRKEIELDDKVNYIMMVMMIMIMIVGMVVVKLK